MKSQNTPAVSTAATARRNNDFMRLFIGNQRRFYGLILTLVPNIADADDLIQETATQMWQKFDDFVPGTDFAAWGLSFARFMVLSFYKKRKAQSRVAFDAELIDSIADEISEVTPSSDRRHEALRGCLGKLPEQTRRLIELRYATGATGKSVAEQLSKSVESIYKAISRTHEALLRCVERTLAAEVRR